MDWDITIKWADTPYDKDKIDEATNVANGLVKAIKDGQYHKGNRNNIAVDLCCSMWMLGYKKDDPELVAGRLKNEGYLTFYQKKNLISRIKVIQEYYDHWYEDWESYWLMPEEWQSWEQNSMQHGYFNVRYEDD